MHALVPAPVFAIAYGCLCAVSRFNKGDCSGSPPATSTASGVQAGDGSWSCVSFDIGQQDVFTLPLPVQNEQHALVIEVRFSLTMPIKMLIIPMLNDHDMFIALHVLSSTSVSTEFIFGFS